MFPSMSKKILLVSAQMSNKVITECPVEDVEGTPGLAFRSQLHHSQRFGMRVQFYISICLVYL